jgi:hypothetical protein
LFFDAVFLFSLLVRRSVSGFVTDIKNYFKTSTVSYTVIGFTNIQTLNGTMQHKVLKFLNIFENNLGIKPNGLIMSDSRGN